MFLLKKNFALTSAELNEIKIFVGRTIESMLIAKEETLFIFKKYDLVLICALEGNYIVSDIFQLSQFKTYDKQFSRKNNIPFYSAARSIGPLQETIVYVDDHKEKGFGIKRIQAFYHICDLLNTMDIDVFSHKEYRCIW